MGKERGGSREITKRVGGDGEVRPHHEEGTREDRRVGGTGEGGEASEQVGGPGEGGTSGKPPKD